MLEFTTPLAINQCKSGDTLLFRCEDDTPYEPVIYIYSLDGVLLSGPHILDYERDGYLYWDITASSSFGMSTVKTYYKVIIDDDWPSGFVPKTFVVYVNNDLVMEGYIVRALGLAGHNVRYYSYTWENGQLTSFYIKTYETKTALETAENGGTDTYLAAYLVTIRYNDDYNPYEISYVKQ